VHALRSISEVLSVAGLDLVFIGANDLSANMGLFNQPSHPLVQDAIHKILVAGQRAQIPVGVMASDPDDANRRFAEGFQFVGIGEDVRLLSATCRSLCQSVQRDLAGGKRGS
jgi:2-keto-3-deoxy-L-rhamnonate aldolase RhmA